MEVEVEVTMPAMGMENMEEKQREMREIMEADEPAPASFLSPTDRQRVSRRNAAWGGARERSASRSNSPVKQRGHNSDHISLLSPRAPKTEINRHTAIHICMHTKGFKIRNCR